MKTIDIITGPEAKVVAALKEMKIKELEKNARKIFAKLGQQEFDQVLSIVIKTIPGLSGVANLSPYDAVKSTILENIPANTDDEVYPGVTVDGVVDRLSVILLLLISKKFEKFMRERHLERHSAALII